jgi:hypothetical protein
MPFLQTKQGKAAQGFTSQEFADFMRDLKDIMDSPEKSQLLGRNERWLYSWDNDKIHKGADLEGVGFEEGDRFPLPELSSDMHKVVEHCHAWLDAAMQRWLEEHEDEQLTGQQCMDELVRLFEEELPLEGIRKDVNSLNATYKAVIAAEGGYVEAKFR